MHGEQSLPSRQRTRGRAGGRGANRRSRPNLGLARLCVARLRRRIRSERRFPLRTRGPSIGRGSVIMELLKKLRMSRRFALRGALGGIGVAMWLPVLDAMCNNNGTAFAAGDALPPSFGTRFWGNGGHPDVWTPTNTGSGDEW